MEKEVIRIVRLEDVASPRRAQYSISLKQLTEGYVVETCWGGVAGKKAKEAYYREDLPAAVAKFERLLSSKTGSRHHSNRQYQAVKKDQLSLLLLVA